MLRVLKLRLFQISQRSQLLMPAKNPRSEKMELSALRVALAKKEMKTSLISHSRKEQLLSSRSKTSTSKKKERMLLRRRLKKTRLPQLPRLLEVLRAKRRPLLRLLPNLLVRNQLRKLLLPVKLRPALIRS